MAENQTLVEGKPVILDRAELDTLKAQVNLADVVAGCGVDVLRVKDRVMALCPLHAEQTPSFSINGQLWKCFGCGAKGDVLDFLQQKEGLSFPLAIQRLQALVGTVPPARPADPTPESPDRLAGGFTRPELLSRIASFYASHLKQSKEARDYLQQRGLGVPELWEAFQLGYVDGALLHTLPEQGDLKDALTQLGILNERGKEHFYGCIVVPLLHPDTGVVGLYGRRILPDSKARHLYLRGPQRGVLNWQALKGAPSMVLAESVFDALSIWLSGTREVTCLYGASHLHSDLDELLRRYKTQEIRFCLDADPAGQKTTEHLAELFSRRGLRCLSVTLPDGHDPNEVLVTGGPEALRLALQETRTVGGATQPTAEPTVERRDDGFTVRFGAVTYKIMPKPPFTGRLQVVLKGAHAGQTSTDLVNLYSDHSRVGAVRKMSRRLGLKKEEVEPHVAFLLAESERWVEAVIHKSEGGDRESIRPEPLSDSEKAVVLAFLLRPDLVDVVLCDMEAMGYVGEEKGKLLAYLIGLSRRMERPMSGIVLSQSGAGKSSMTELVELLCPPEEVELFSRLSPMSLGYLPKDYLKRKLLILEERTGAESSDYFIRTLQTKNYLRHAVPMKDPITGQMSTRIMEVEGPIAYLETTTSSRINFENSTRCFLLTLDESEAQTARIHAHQRKSRDFDTVLRNADQRETPDAIRRRHHQAQRLLEPARILNRFERHLRFPTRWLRTRRDHERFLSLMEVITLLHQYQREAGTFSEGGQPVRYAVATVGDYRLAYELARDVLGTTLHELSRHAIDLKDPIRALVEKRGDPRHRHEVTFTRRELRDFTQWEDHRLRDTLNELVEMEHLAVEGGSQGKTFRYRLLPEPDGEPVPLAGLTTPDELAEKMAATGTR